MDFEFYTAARIIFGAGKFKEIGKLAREHGKQALVIIGGGSLQKAGVVQRLVDLLGEHGIVCNFYQVTGEPQVETVDEGVSAAKKSQTEMVISLGGGSVIDTGKAISGLVTNGGSVMDYLEGVGKGKRIARPALPFIAIPTTAGTGSEVTKNAVICSRTQKFKKSIRSPHLIPKIALVDPLLTHTMPPAVTASSGLDALTQLIEAYVSKGANPITDALAQKGITLAASSLYRAYCNGNDAEARQNMALASLLSGIVLANAGLGAVHGIAAALGGLFPIPHGIACAVLLPHVVEMNFKALLTKNPVDSIVKKYRQLCKLLLDKEINPKDGVSPAVEFLHGLCEKMAIPSLTSFGINKDDIPSIVAHSRGSSMRFNPVELSDEELITILEKTI